MLRFLVVCCASATLFTSIAEGAPSITMAHFERLSLDLRGHRLRQAERKTIETALADDAAGTYDAYIDAWLTKDSYVSFVDAFLGGGSLSSGAPFNAESFFLRLEASDGVHYLPHQGTCSADDAVNVQGWWQEAPIRICPDSYRPEAVFDEVGYCSGEAEPFSRQPPRSGCGCGPLLMGCLPPYGDNETLDEQVRTSVRDEWFETATSLVHENRPLDELVTTSRTWQTGLIQFLYLRRELVGMLSERAWSEELDAEMRALLSEIEVDAPGRWVERQGVYEGTGLWWSSMAMHALKVPVRGAAHLLLNHHLCSEFHAANVDADAILKAVGKNNENLRTLNSILASPMRFQPGCQGCHLPMDGAAGFFAELQHPLYGSFPTGEPGEGEFFVTGAGDFRGKGAGLDDLARFVVSAPEFETCSVRRAFEEVLVRPVTSSDHELFDELVEKFRTNGHRWKPIIRGLLTSDTYMNQAPPTDELPSLPQGDVSKTVTDVVERSCVSCHNDTHYLDLTRLPDAEEVAIWESILTRVSDSSMPPPVQGDNITDRFPLDPSVRTSFTAAVRTMLGAASDRSPPSRRLTHRMWRSVAHDVAAPEIGAARVDAIIDGFIPSNGFLAKRPPRGPNSAYQLAVERASEAMCRAVATAKPLPLDELWRRLHGVSPSSSELESTRDLLARFETVAPDAEEAWTALCATELASPNLFFALYAQGGE